MAYSKKEIENIFNAICDRIEQGESLRSVLRDDNMPSSQTFYIWVDSDELKSKQYARATELRAENIFDEIFDIADDGRNDFTQKNTSDGVIEVFNSEHVQRSRLRIDTRKWALSKMNPKKYGDKVGIDHTTKGETMPPIHINVTSEKAKKLIEDL
ncbi:MAG: hypothetical protein PHR19_08245 [Bacteroidales bacterium]|nr:hypothetical protein [Bacteroidales bacterium]